MFESLLAGLALLFTFKAILFMCLGVIIGVVFGVIPGLGGVTAIALLTPLTIGMEANEAIALMGGVMGATSFGGSISAILINTPGVAVNAATCFDGYPLARQGKAGLAIGAAAAASSLGGILGILMLLAILPLAKSIVLAFGPPEFFLLTLLGLSVIALSAGDAFLRALIAGGFGLMLAFVGYDNVHGDTRFSFGIDYLWDGIPLVPALVGAFAIAEMINLTIDGGTIATSKEMVKVSKVSEGVRAALIHWRVVLRGSAIGTFVGALPGVGGTVAAFVAYSATVQSDKDSQSYGKGNIKGVIAPESANNAKDGGSLLPTLAFGIPGSAETAIFLGVLVMHGMEPGPMLLIENGDVMLSLIFAVMGSSILASIIGLVLARHLALITLLDVRVLAPSVISVALVGVYSLRGEFGDIILAMIFGIVGYLMVRHSFPRISLVIGLVLGKLAEVSFHQSIAMSDGSWAIFFNRGLSLALFIVILLCLSFPFFKYLKFKRKSVL